MSPASSSPKKPATEMPKCPICGRRNTVRKSGEGLFFCDRCREMFRV